MKREHFFVAFIALFLFLFFLLLSVRLYIFNEGYYLEQLKTNVVSLSNAPSLTAEVIGFLRGDGELGDSFSLNEKSHMDDVQRLVVFGQGLFLALALGIICIFFAIKKYAKKPSSCIAQGLILSGILVYAFLLFGFFGLYWFDFAFTGFHALFFPQGNWQFPIGSTLITLFPEAFFQTIAKDILLTFLMFGTLMVGCGAVWWRWLKANSPKN